jgi:hypothetical protein
LVEGSATIRYTVGKAPKIITSTEEADGMLEWLRSNGQDATLYRLSAING